jgi:streptomycin 6-kinase
MNNSLERVQAKAAQWNVSLDEIRETETSLVGFGVRDGTRVVLKLTKQAGDESHSGAVLQAYEGVGAVRVYEAETGAALLERLDPGEQLVNVVKQSRDEQATQILAEVISRLAGRQAPSECPTVADWGRGFDRYLESEDRQIPHMLVYEARDLYRELVSSQRTTMLLHGDLQHYNVLFDNERGWLAIDPKGVIGELEYEAGALLRNPVEMPEIFANPATIKRRLEILTTSLHLDPSRTLRWSYAQAILSGLWDVEDRSVLSPTNASLLLAHTLKNNFF